MPPTCAALKRQKKKRKKERLGEVGFANTCQIFLNKRVVHVFTLVISLNLHNYPRRQVMLIPVMSKENRTQTIKVTGPSHMLIGVRSPIHSLVFSLQIQTPTSNSH